MWFSYAGEETINGKDTKSPEVPENLEMGQATNGKAERVWVRLPCFYTQEGSPVDRNKVAAINKVKRWGYPGRIKAETIASDNIDITLLICANCVKTLELPEVKAKVHMQLKHSGDGAL